MSNIVISKRKDIPHLVDMNDYEFLYWLVNENVQWEPRVHQKLDGFMIKIGRDSQGEFFFTTARSEVIRDPAAVLWHTISREPTGAQLDRGMKISEMFRLIEGTVDIPHNTYFECEAFYKPLAHHDGNDITFVTLPYRSKSFEKDLTLFVHSVKQSNTGEEVQDTITSSEIDIRASRLKLRRPIDLTDFKKYVEAMSDQEILSLRSLKHKDREMKLRIKQETSTLKRALREMLLESKDIEQLNVAKHHEGMVFHIGEKQFKTVTDYYWEYRNATL